MARTIHRKANRVKFVTEIINHLTEKGFQAKNVYQWGTEYEFKTNLNTLYVTVYLQEEHDLYYQVFCRYDKLVEYQTYSVKNNFYIQESDQFNFIDCLDFAKDHIDNCFDKIDRLKK